MASAEIAHNSLNTNTFVHEWQEESNWYLLEMLLGSAEKKLKEISETCQMDSKEACLRQLFRWL